MVKVKEILTKDPEEFQYLKMGEKKKKRKRKEKKKKKDPWHSLEEKLL